MKGKYQGNLALQQMMSFISSSSFMTAQQMRSASFWMQPLMDMTLGYYDRNPLQFSYNGIRKLAALHPSFRKIANRFPDTITIQYGTGQAPEIQRDFSDVTIVLNAARPYRNLEAFGYAANLQSHAHEEADFSHLIKAKKIESVLKGTDEDLVKFTPKKNMGKKRPVYLIAPRSGHYATLVSPIVQNYLDQGIPVYLNKIKNAAETPFDDVAHGMDQQVDDKVDGLQRIHELEGISPDVVAICQGAIPMTIAIAKLCEENSLFKPNTFAFLSGPGDVSVTKSIVNEFGEETPNSIIDKFAISTVPGNGKKVRAGHAQVGDFMSGNPGRHLHDITTIMNFIVRNGSKWAHDTPLTQEEILAHLKKGNLDKLEKSFLKQVLFRTEYMTHADQDAASYNDALNLNFKGNFLANGTATHHGKPVSLSKIDIPVLTGDAIKDDISTIGQAMGILQYLGSKALKSALIIPDKGHFWWAGKTAKADQWPQIMKWQENPKKSDIPRFKASMLDEAKAIHAANKKTEQEVIDNGKPFSITTSHKGVTVPLTPSMPMAA